MASDKLPAGIHTAALTPLTADLDADIPAFLGHARWLLDHGSDGIGVLGTTGEANSLAYDQRLAVIEASVANLPADRLLVGTGACAVADAIALTRASLAGGANNVLLLPPFYYKPITDPGVHRFIATLVDRVADSRLRIYLYNFPQMTTHSFSVDFIGQLRADFGDVIAGMKDSSGDWDHMQQSIDAHPGFDVFAGTETYLLDTLAAGGAGCISASANVTSNACQGVYQAWRAGESAAADLQQRLSAIRLLLQNQKPPIPHLKALMQRHTGDPAWQHVLPPFAPAGDVAALAAELADLGLPSPGAPLPDSARAA